MSRRPTGSYTKESPNHVKGSMFDPDTPLVIPLGTRPSVHRMTEVILGQNPHLEQPQVEAVVRLAKLYEQFDLAEQKLGDVGMTQEDRFGLEKPHPMVNVVTSLQNAIVTQERNLAISVPSRNEQVPKGDRAPAARSTPPTPPGRPKLRLA